MFKQISFFIIAVLSGILLLLFVQCSSNRPQQGFSEIPHAIWQKGQTVDFEFELTKPLEKGRILLAVRHATVIPYSDLPILYALTKPNSQPQAAKLNLKIKDAAGENLGSGMGDMWDLEQALEAPMQMPSGKYSLKIAHGLETDALLISEVGYIVEDLTEK